MGLFALVLHTHLPYVRRNGVSPCGEDFFHEAASGSWLPLLDVLGRVPPGARLTVGITPVLANQMEDPHVLRELRWYLGRIEIGAQRIVAQTGFMDTAGFHAAAADAALRARGALALLDSLDGGIASGYASLSRAGVIQIAGGPATHPLLGEIRHPAMQRAQVALGAAEHERIFGRRPTAMWLPECAYAPATGIEETFAAEGVGAFVVDQHLLGGPSTRPMFVGASNVAALGMDRSFVDAIWTAGGYPGDPWYRDFGGAEYETGLKLFRITADDGWATMKQPYDPVPAARRAAEHAADYVAKLERRFEETGDDAVVTAAFDTELFGHWWLEGPQFVGHLLALLARHPTIRAVTLEEALADAPPKEHIELPRGTWGLGGDYRSWIAPAADDAWKAIAFRETETVRLVGAHDNATGDQLLREQLLLASSDFTWMLGLDRNAQYGRERIDAHVERWDRLAAALKTGGADALAAEIHEIDNPFPDLSAARRALASSLPSFGRV